MNLSTYPGIRYIVKTAIRAGVSRNPKGAWQELYSEIRRIPTIADNSVNCTGGSETARILRGRRNPDPLEVPISTRLRLYKADKLKVSCRPITVNIDFTAPVKLLYRNPRTRRIDTVTVIRRRIGG